MIPKNEQIKFIVPKAPKPKITTIPKKISYINLIEVDDDDDYSEQNEVETVPVSTKNKEICKEDGYLSDDRYADSFEEEFGDGCETNPDSGNVKKLSEK